MRALALAALLALTPMVASAADFSVNGSMITVRGFIGPDDGFKFKQAMDVVEAADGIPITQIRLDTGGGVISEALTMGQTIQARGMAAVVAAGDTCASACVMLFLSAPVRYFQKGGRLGVHQARDTGDNTTSHAGTWEMSDWIARFHVPTVIVEKMHETPSDGISWLTASDIRRIGGIRYIASDGTVLATKESPSSTDYIDKDVERLRYHGPRPLSLNSDDY